MNSLELLVFIQKEQYSFISREQLEHLAKEQETSCQPVIVRCGGGRFTCTVQAALHFTDIITKEGSDYVRDVSLK